MQTFDQIFYVGDSLTDAGGIFGITSALIDAADKAGIDTTGFDPIPISPPYAGRFSNGPVYAETVPGLLGVPAGQVFNFAFGGAEALGEQTLLDAAGSLITPALSAMLQSEPAAAALINQNLNLDGQLDLFDAALTGMPPSPNSAASIFIGLNDFAAFEPSSLLAAPFEIFGLAADVIDANLNAARHFANAGVGTIILNTLPDATFFPASNFLDPFINTIGDLAIDTVNIGLRTGAFLLGFEGIEVEIVDLNALTDEITADGLTFGFLELQEPVQLGNGTVDLPNPAVDPEDIPTTAFFDPVHLTANLHGVFAAFTEASLNSNTQLRGDGLDFVFGTGRDDLVLAGGGRDFVWLHGGDDVAIGGTGQDRVFAGSGSDLVSGGAGNDRVKGGAGSDVIAGASGNDRLYGNDGNDALIGGLGADSLFGGDDDDILVFTDGALLGGDNTASDRYDGGKGFDILLILTTEENKDADLSVFNLVINSIEQVIYAVDQTVTEVLESLMPADFSGPNPLTPDLSDRLAEADLFGFI